MGEVVAVAGGVGGEGVGFLGRSQLVEPGGNGCLLGRIEGAPVGDDGFQQPLEVRLVDRVAVGLIDGAPVEDVRLDPRESRRIAGPGVVLGDDA